MKIDDWLCTAFQKLADGLQALTGCTCLFYASVCLVCNLGFSLLGDLSVMNICISSGLFAVNCWTLTIARRLNQPGMANPFKSGPWIALTRMFIIYFLIYYFVLLVRHPDLKNVGCFLERLSFTAFVYFLGCTPKPPGRA